MNAMARFRRVLYLPLHALGLAIAISIGAVPAFAQEMDHSKMQTPPATPAKKPTTKKPAVKPAAVKKQATDPHAGHGMPPPKAAPATTPQEPAAVDHATTGHDMPEPTQAEPIDHAAMGHDMPMPQDAAQPMDHAAMPGMTMAPSEPVTPIPPLTDADRAAAVPPPGGHAVHDNSIQRYVLINRLEAWDADQGSSMQWEAQGWIGTDLNRLWLRSEGERVGGETESADLEVLYGRSVARWWDLVAGVRQDFKPGDAQTFAAFGVIGLAPQKFEVEATAYAGSGGQTALRFEAERELLITNRLILQPLIEVELYGKDDPSRGIGSGVSTVEAGLRLRYEFTRKLAPYLGIVRERAFGGTADLRRADGDDIDDTRVVAGLRIWF